MYKALDVGDFVVWRFLKDNQVISNLKLQSVLYYLQSYWLCKYNQPLFQDRIAKGRMGPIVEEVYNVYKIYGSSRIHEVGKYIRLKNDGNVEIIEYQIENSPIEKRYQKEISKVLEGLYGVNGLELLDKIKNHPMYQRDWLFISRGITWIAYDLNELKQFFEQNPSERIWETVK